MKVNNRCMYHFHKKGIKDEIWVPGSEFVVDDSFSANFNEETLRFSTIVRTKSGDKICVSDVLSHHLETDFNDLTDEQKKELLTISYAMLKDTGILLREYGLEEYRKAHFPDLPSRLHSIWVCNKTSMEFWKKTLSSDGIERELLELELSGTLFKSSDEFFPPFGTSFLGTYNMADRYWDPDFTSKHNKREVEYLFQGHVRVKGKIE